MNCINLMPPRLLAAKRRRRAVQRWIVIDSVIATALVCTAVVALTARSVPSAAFGTTFAPADAQAVNATLTRVRNESLRLKAELQSQLDLSTSPDWSILLAALSRTMGDQIVFNVVDCRAAVQPAAGAEKPRGLVNIDGIGQSQLAVTQFALRIEAMHFFGSVKLNQTSQSNRAGSEGVGFQLSCTLPDSAGGKQ